MDVYTVMTHEQLAVQIQQRLEYHGEWGYAEPLRTCLLSVSALKDGAKALTTSCPMASWSDLRLAEQVELRFGELQ